MARTVQIRPGVSAVVLDDRSRVLLQLRTDNGRWGLPGGAVEYSESVSDAIVREVLEETGLTVTITRLVGVYSHPDHHQIVTYPDGNTIHFVSVCFECAPTAGRLRLSDETAGLAWWGISDPPSNLMPIHRVRLQDAAARAATPFIR